jgi:hypothetical protein
VASPSGKAVWLALQSPIHEFESLWRVSLGTVLADLSLQRAPLACRSCGLGSLSSVLSNRQEDVDYLDF